MGNICTNTNGLGSYAEEYSIQLIEVDPYWRYKKYNPTKPNPVKVSAVTFSGRSKTGVDLRSHTRQEFRDLSSEQKDKLTSWQGSNEDKDSTRKQRNINRKKRRSDQYNSNKLNWRNKSKKEIKMQSGLSQIMSIMIEEGKKTPLSL